MSAPKKKAAKDPQKGRYFPGTIDLVFRNRKQLYLSQQRRKGPEEESESIKAAIDRIELIPLD